MENIILIGAEDVSRAGSNILSAASDMVRAASVINESVYIFQEQVEKLEQIAEGLMKAINKNS